MTTDITIKILADLQEIPLPYYTTNGNKSLKPVGIAVYLF